MIGCEIGAVKARAALKLEQVAIPDQVTVECAGGDMWRGTLVGTLTINSEGLSEQLLGSCGAAQGHPAVLPFKRLAAFVPASDGHFSGSWRISGSISGYCGIASRRLRGRSSD